MSDEAIKTSQFLEMDKIPSAFYPKLKAVGLPTPEDPNFRHLLYDFLHSEFNVSETDFRVMRVAQLDAYLDRWIHKNRAMESSPDIGPHVRNGKIEWHETERKLIAHIIEEHHKAGGRREDDRQTVLQKAGNYVKVRKDGTRKDINPESAWRSYDQQFS